MSSDSYTLSRFFGEAGLPAIPSWAKQVKLSDPPFQHQIGDVNFLAQSVRSGLFNDPGVGKTRSMQAYGLWLAGQGNKVVFTMPPILVDQFVDSLATSYIGSLNFVSVESLKGNPKKRDARMGTWNMTSWPDFLVLSYRMFVMYHETLKRKGYTCVMVDEAHAVKNPSSQLHHAVLEFAGEYNHTSNGVVLTTGTPIETNLIDAYGLIAILRPARYGSMRAFERIHCIFKPKTEEDEEPAYPIIIGYKNLDYLNIGLMASGRRVKKSDVLDLPPRIFDERKVKLSSKHKTLYKKLVDERLAELPNNEIIDLTTQAALYQAIQKVILSPELYTDEEIKENKVLEELDFLLDSLSGRKVVVYCWYRASVEKLVKTYSHLNPAVLYGGTSENQRTAQKMKFIQDDSCKLLISNPKSGGVGVDGLQHVCSHVIYAEVCPFPGPFYQSVDRLHRAGQNSDAVNIYIIVPEGTVAVKLRNDLVKKDALQEQVVKDKRSVLSDLLGADGIQGSLDSIPENYEFTDAA